MLFIDHVSMPISLIAVFCVRLVSRLLPSSVLLPFWFGRFYCFIRFGGSLPWFAACAVLVAFLLLLGGVVVGSLLFSCP
jgi:hypothetical protein